MHLQYTGHPIANDSLYINDTVASRSTEGVSADKAAMFSKDHSRYQSQVNANTDDAEESSIDDFIIDPMCTNCPNLAPKG